MKRILIILTMLLSALQGQAQVVLDKVGALYAELSAFRSSEEAFVRNTPDSIVYYIYVDVYEQATEPVLQARDGKLAKMSETDSLQMAKRYHGSKVCYDKVLQSLKTLAKDVLVQMHWESHRKAGDSVMWSMTFSNSEHLRFEFKPLQTYVEHPEFRYQIPKAGGWLVYTYVKVP